MAALIRCVIALHNLVNNKIKYKKLHGLDDDEDEKKDKKDEDKKDEAKEGEEGKDGEKKGGDKKA